MAIIFFILVFLAIIETFKDITFTRPICDWGRKIVNESYEKGSINIMTSQTSLIEFNEIDNETIFFRIKTRYFPTSVPPLAKGKVYINSTGKQVIEIRALLFLEILLVYWGAISVFSNSGGDEVYFMNFVIYFFYVSWYFYNLRRAKKLLKNIIQKEIII